MQLICKAVNAFLVILVTSVSCFGAEANITRFLQERGVPDDVLMKLEQAADLSECFHNKTYLICVEKKRYARIEENSIARQAIIKGLSVRVKHSLYKVLLKYSDINHFNNRKVLEDTYISGNEMSVNQMLLRGIEFLAGSIGNSCMAVASIPLQRGTSEVSKYLKSPKFIARYCQNLITTGNNLLKARQIKSILPIIDELEILKCSSIDYQFLKLNTLAEMGNIDEANILALSILNKNSRSLKSSQYEKLGNILIQIGNPTGAEKAYQLAVDTYDLP